MKKFWTRVFAVLILFVIKGSLGARASFSSSSYPSSSSTSSSPSLSTITLLNVSDVQSTLNQSFTHTLPDTRSHYPPGRETQPINASSFSGDQSGLRLPLYLRCTATTICVILLIIGCAGNMLVPFVVLKTKDLRNSTNIFLINLSISDILVLIISTPTVLIELHSQPEVWFLGSFVCEYYFKTNNATSFHRNDTEQRKD